VNKNVSTVREGYIFIFIHRKR